MEAALACMQQHGFAVLPALLNAGQPDHATLEQHSAGLLTAMQAEAAALLEQAELQHLEAGSDATPEDIARQT